MSDTNETRWFKIFAFIGTGFFAGLFLANIVYYNRVRTGGVITKNEALSMLILNGILFAIAFILFIWCLYRLLVTEDTRAVIKEAAVSYVHGTNGGYNIPVMGAGTQAPVAGGPVVQVSRQGSGSALSALGGKA